MFKETRIESSFMKFKVSYYDHDSDKFVTKDCDKMDFSNGEFSFYPVDNPVKIYKAVIIDHPKVSIHQNNNRIKIIVTGYQCMKDGDYWKTNTTFESVKED